MSLACFGDHAFMLYHVSEEADIARFLPRASESMPGEVVWAIAAERLHNYLVPRACPRVTYYAGPRTIPADVERFLGTSPAVVAVESGWAERVGTTRLHCYELPASTFHCVDEPAGYYVSRVPVTPCGVQTIESPLLALLERGIELRFLPDLRSFGDAVAASTLQFSLIRMRNARGRAQCASAHG